MKTSTERNVLRTIHFVGAACIGTFVYSPWSSVEWFALLNQVLVVPLLSLTGLWMWQGHRIKARSRR